MLSIEISEALQAQCTVIPVLPVGSDMPTAKELPVPVRALTDLNAAQLSDNYRNDDIKMLIDKLRDLPTSTTALQKDPAGFSLNIYVYV